MKTTVLLLSRYRIFLC